MRPNNSFKPNLLRYSNNMAEKACHVLASTTQVGLIQALGALSTNTARHPMNRWNIPDWLEKEVIARDTDCVYCRSPFASPAGPRRSRPSWEHIVNDLKIITLENIVLCCIGCNSSKGARELDSWLFSPYCQSRGIGSATVAAVVGSALLRRPAVNADGA